MVAPWVVVLASAGYLGLLFAVAGWADRRAARGRSVISSGSVYALSLAVYVTSWTYYGSVGRAASDGVGFLPIYLGPTLALALWWVVVRRIVRICRRDRITSLSDFVAARYGGSAGLGALVTVVAVVGVLPYLALQLKAISTTYDVLRAPEVPSAAAVLASPPVLQDTALWAALLLAAFTVVFGTRSLDAGERHEGMVAAVAVESLVKLGAFLAVGAWVVFGLFDGFGDVFAQAAGRADLARLLAFDEVGSTATWTWLIVLSALAVLLLPRQWQVAVVENVDERHLRTASWLLPLYLLLANVFVLPIALAGLLTFGRDGADPDTFVLALPLADGRPGLALVVFLGGLAAATGMVIVETIALSTMVSNSLVLPLLLRRGGALARRPLPGLVLAIRRTTIVAVLLLAFGYFRVAGETRALVTIGLVSFAAVAQFAPAVLGGLFWRGATLRGAAAGLAAGFAVWAYTLLLPFLASTAVLPGGFLEDGPFGIGLLAPQSLLGLDGLDDVSHAMTWSLLLNVGLFVGLSVTGQGDQAQRAHAEAFLDVSGVHGPGHAGTATVGRLGALLERFVGPERAEDALSSYAVRSGAGLDREEPADPALVHHVETQLAGAVGSASARLAVASVVGDSPLGGPEVLEILDENARLQELDRLKDDFVSTVTHELRTPLTSIRAFSEILLDNPGLDPGQRQAFLRTVVDETDRLTRLINQVLDLSKLESGVADWRIEPVDLAAVVASAVAAAQSLATDAHVDLAVEEAGPVPAVRADRDRVHQVVTNLLSNAVKFAASGPGAGLVRVAVWRDGDAVRVAVTDDGPGLTREEQEVVFDRFRQGGGTGGRRPPGTGLGLAISREIVGRLGGTLEVDSTPGEGATFSFALPLAAAPGLATVGGERAGEGPEG